MDDHRPPTPSAANEPPACVVPVEVGEHTIYFAVPGEIDSSDPIAAALGDGCFPSDSVNHLWRELVGEESKVIDVGAHLGMYSLPAAALGADVIAVEASPRNATLLKLASERNSFTKLQVLRIVASAREGKVPFVALGPYGHVATASEASGDNIRETPMRALDEVVSEHGWHRVDVVKIDVEGFELDVLEGMTSLLRREDAPPVLIEANGHMLRHYGAEPKDILARLEAKGYRCFLVDSATPGSLVPVSSNDLLQAECVADYLAYKSVPALGQSWMIREPFSRAEIVSRIIETTETYDAHRIHRSYGERVIDGAPQWLKEDDGIEALKQVLNRENFNLGFSHVQ